MANTENRRLVIPLFIFLGMMAVGINTINRGIASHEIWRVVISVVPMLMFTTATGMILYRARYHNKSSSEDGETLK